MTRSLMFVALFALLAAGCGSLRDAGVYATEVQFVDLSTQRSAPYVRGFLSLSCACSAETFAWTSSTEGGSPDECVAAADWYRTYASRWAWHVAMMRYNGGMTSVDPGAIPDVVENSCDLAAPGTSGGES